MSHNQRLIKYIKSKGLTIKEFSTQIEVEYNKLNKYLNGSTKNPGANVVISILKKYPDLNGRWWLCAEGEMQKGQEVPADSMILKKKSFDKMQAELLDYLKTGNEALKDYNQALKNINALEKEIHQLKDHIRILEGK